MAKEHIIPITNGIGSKELADGNYATTANIVGYDNSTLTPAEVEITGETTDLEFTIAATGTLTIHVTDDGTEIGIPIVGATLYRCDSEGNTYGEAITTNDEGNAVFNFVPYSESENPPTVYFKQTASDGEHNFDDSLQNTTLEAETKTIEIANTEATTRNIKLTDAYYENLPIADGNITLTDQE